jgi:hypothetical protein
MYAHVLGMAVARWLQYYYYALLCLLVSVVLTYDIYAS